jgi:hypothetical protein
VEFSQITGVDQPSNSSRGLRHSGSPLLASNAAMNDCMRLSLTMTKRPL